MHYTPSQSYLKDKTNNYAGGAHNTSTFYAHALYRNATKQRVIAEKIVFDGNVCVCDGARLTNGI